MYYIVNAFLMAWTSKFISWLITYTSADTFTLILIYFNCDSVVNESH